MEVSVELKRPWTIKVFTVVFGLMYGLSLFQFFYDLTKPLLFIYMLSIVVSVYGIWQGRYWARNLFFILSIPMIFLLFFGSGAILVQMNTINDLFIAFGALLFASMYLLIFFKQSREWFQKVNSNNSKSGTNKLTWQMQLMVIIIAIVLGALAEAISAKLDLIPLMSELARNFVSPYSKLTIGVTIHALGFLIAATVTLLPFTVLMGIWKNKFHFLIGRLIGIGVMIPLIVVFFVLGKNDRISIYIGLFFLSSVIVAILMIYVGLFLSKKASWIFENLQFKNRFVKN